MRNFLALIGLVVVVLAVAGWYLGWYKLSYTTTPDGTLKIQTDVDTKKVGSDSSEVFKNVGSAISTQADKAAQDARNSPPAAMPGPVNTQHGPEINPMTPTAPVPTIPSIPTPPQRSPGTIPLIAPKPNN